ncbi:MAG: hypothetical protein Q4B23_00545 [Helcococcus sp.]|nr:hypothetical protein [Helcococcus sp.]
MRVELERSKLDLGTTPVENMFINTLMASANESQIKVYLYALSLAYSNIEDITNENIAREMNITEGQVYDAWNYWINQGIVEKSDNGYIFKSMRAQLFGVEDDFPKSSKNFEITENTEKLKSINQDFTNIDEADTKQMIDSIEAFISQDKTVPVKLDPREIRKLLELRNDFQSDPNYISYAYMMASNVRGKKSVDTIVATIRNWIIDGAKDMESLDKYLEEKDNSNKKSKTNEDGNKPSKTSRQELYKNDNRMTKAERNSFIEWKLKQKLPIKKRDN